MRLAIAIAAAATALTAAGAAAAAPSVEIRDAIARVTVIPEDRADVKVEMLTTNASLPLEVRTVARTTVISGNLAHRIRDCQPAATIRPPGSRGVGGIDYENMPQVVIHTPKAVSSRPAARSMASSAARPASSLDNSGCSAWTIADVAGDATLHGSGAGSVQMGSAGRLELQPLRRRQRARHPGPPGPRRDACPARAAVESTTWPGR